MKLHDHGHALMRRVNLANDRADQRFSALKQGEARCNERRLAFGRHASKFAASNVNDGLIAAGRLCAAVRLQRGFRVDARLALELLPGARDYARDLLDPA